MAFVCSEDSSHYVNAVSDQRRRICPICGADVVQSS